ncbi:DUF4406 domain-containing protein [Brumimicrobium mesophilum]|uniref:DUF4406 domain-containing protein n=1 Tax=Brumimicrobium mesophilum TaxID=392717 RepID=UPI000D142C17|nr:DUF4406 domain-containing protein [Brumimicrobium mesophilum]
MIKTIDDITTLDMNESQVHDLAIAMATGDKERIKELFSQVDKRKSIYIAGKITGMEEKAFELFGMAEKALVEFGHRVINPMKLPHDHDKTWSSYMRECIQYLVTADSIFLLPNWKESPGAKVEFQIATALEMNVYFKVQELIN